MKVGSLAWRLYRSERRGVNDGWYDDALARRCVLFVEQLAPEEVLALDRRLRTAEEVPDVPTLRAV